MGKKDREAIVLMNLGSPDSPNLKDVRKYLGEFLMDPKVIDVPYPLRLLLVRGIIVPFRTPNSASKYESIWTEEGSPLVHITGELTKLVSDDLDIPAYMCMRYGVPSPSEMLNQIHNDNPGLERLTLVPLYPHFAMSSYETAVEYFLEAYRNGNYTFKVSIVAPFYNDPNYINALAESISPYLLEEYDHVLFSYHGIPERHIKKSDVTGMHCLKCTNCCEVPSEAHDTCYRHQVITTTKLVAALLEIPKAKYSFSFQSRLGRDKWLLPFTADQLKDMPRQGIKKIIVACPAFVIDCLETLEEINMEAREIFMESGGETFTLIPCLNLNPAFVKTLSALHTHKN